MLLELFEKIIEKKQSMNISNTSTRTEVFER